MKAFIFDTETTGLVKNRTIKLDDQPEVIEFYGALVDLSKKGGKILMATRGLSPRSPV